MPTLVISIDGAVIKEVPLTKERATLGRRPYNDIVIDNLAVSGEHAVLHMQDDTVTIEDLRSTNGTFVNGQPVQRQVLEHGDLLDIGKYKIRFVHPQAQGSNPRATPASAALAAVQSPRSARMPLSVSSGFGTEPLGLPSAFDQSSGFANTDISQMAYLPLRQAAIRMLNGTAAGRQVPLVKIVTTLGKPGVAVASITQKPHGFVLAQIEGQDQSLTLNGQQVGRHPAPLLNGDTLELAGTQMQFLLA